MKLKQGQEVFFITKDEDRRVFSYQRGKFMYAKSGGPKGCCMVQIEFNGQTFNFPVPRCLIYTSKKDVCDQIHITCMIYGWRMEI